MFRISFLLLFLLTLSSAQKNVSGFKPVAVIELFTSEGCNSCPAADKLFAETIAEAQTSGKSVYGLAFHVDYWNRLGWKDSFSSSQFSTRQNTYASTMHLDGVYTPQMVVNGTTQFVGSDKSSLDKAILSALLAKSPVGFSSLTAVKSGKGLTVNYGLQGNYAGCKVNCALITLHASTSVKNGENRGHVLQHTHVVRQFISSTTATSGKIIFDDVTDYDMNNTAVIAFVQQVTDLHITTAAMVKIQN